MGKDLSLLAFVRVCGEKSENSGLSFGEKFGNLIREKREEHGLSFAQVAAEAYGPDAVNAENRKSDVQRLEAGGSKNPNAATIAKFRKALGITKEEIDAIRTPDQRSTANLTDQLLEENAKLHKAKTLTEFQIIEMAERVAQTKPKDLTAALRELEQTLGVAEDFKARSQQRSNHPNFIDDVFAEVQRLNDDGQADEAVEEIEQALQQAEAQQTRLLDGLIKQHELRQDVDATVQAILKKMRMEVAETSQHFNALRVQYMEYRQQGRTHGTRFASLMAIALAETYTDQAQSDEERGIALNDLGTTLSELGEREDSTERLNAAVIAYQAALEVYTKNAQSMGWAMTQNNLGGALQELGKREDSPDRLNSAVAAFQAALEVRIKEALPMEWAATQNNLGIVLAELGRREDSPDRLNAAVTAYQAALEVYTKDAVPMGWAMTQFNLCNVHLALFDQRSDARHLDTAQAHLANAVEVFTRAEASQYLKVAAAQQTEINTRRDAL